MSVNPYIGQIMPAASGVVPRGWLPCSGQLLAIQSNVALYSLLGTTYGGDGRTTFALPNLNGRAALGSDLSTVFPGEESGTETVALTLDELPAHTHTLAATTASASGRGGSPVNNLFGTSTSPAVSLFATPDGNDVALAVGANVMPNGGGQPHNNMQPFLVINYMIAMTGAFPARP